MGAYIEVHTTIDSMKAAQNIADALVAQRLAACVQIEGPISSTYWWQGQVEHAQEWRCVIKTRAELYEQVEQAIHNVHSYDEPEIVALPISNGNAGYLHWIEAETSAG